MRTLASLGMGEGQLWVIVLCCSCAVLCCSCVRCWRWGCAGANESIAFFGERMLKNGRGEERGLVIAEGFVVGDE